MKISKKQLRQIIRETRMMHPNPSPMQSRAHPAIRDIVKRQKLLEYEQYVDEEGNIHDDEGNVTRRGSEFGRMYGGGTYGLHAPWERSSSRRSYRPAPDRSQVDAVKAVLDVKEDKFLRSILGQLEAGRKLSAKQKKIVRRIIKKTSEGAGMNPDEALALFEGRKMKVTKRQLRRIIKEEKRKILKEWGDRPETGLPLIDFANAYAGLGDAVQSQVDAIVAAYVNGGGPAGPQFAEVVYEQNPNAIDMAMDRIGRLYLDDSEDYQQIIEALEYAQQIYAQGEAEVEADARAAGDI